MNQDLIQDIYDTVQGVREIPVTGVEKTHSAREACANRATTRCSPPMNGFSGGWEKTTRMRMWKSSSILCGRSRMSCARGCSDTARCSENGNKNNATTGVAAFLFVWDSISANDMKSAVR